MDVHISVSIQYCLSDIINTGPAAVIFRVGSRDEPFGEDTFSICERSREEGSTNWPSFTWRPTMNVCCKDIVRVISDLQAKSQPAAFNHDLRVTCHVRHDRSGSLLTAGHFRLGFEL